MAKKKLKLIDDQMCFGCGKQNSRGLQLKFDLDRRRKRIKTKWIPKKEFQGYADIVHGGMIALVLDELMVNLLWTLQHPAVTAEIAVRLHRPARTDEPMDCEARIESKTGRLFRMKSEAKNPQGKLIATATAKCIAVPVLRKNYGV